MEQDKVEFNIDLFPRIHRVAKAVGRFLTPFNGPAEPYMSDHYRGAENMLADVQQELPFNEPHAVSEGWLAYDDQGNYLDPSEY